VKITLLMSLDENECSEVMKPNFQKYNAMKLAG
jgi:hypothetical protein